MNKPITLLLAIAFMTTAALAQTTTTQETEKQKRDHEIGCIAGTAAGVLLGAAVGGIFGGGVGKSLMEIAGGGGGGFVGHKLACKKQS